jgi:putative salt-induced outer membrane protein
MKQLLIATLVLAALPFTASAQDANASTSAPAPAASDAGGGAAAPASNAAQNGGWTGSGEFGFASSRGNSRTENANAKLGLSQENELWKNNLYLTGLRSKGETTTGPDSDGNPTEKFSTTANRYDTGASVGYKFDPRSYVVTAARYEHDDFGANLWQGIVSVGYGYIALKNERAELSFEVGPGIKRYQPAKSTRPEVNPDGTPVVDANGNPISAPYTPNAESEVVGRSLINGKYRLTDNTALEDTLLIEAGSKNQYYQNDIGLSVSMTKKMALKLGYQIRYNSDTQPGTVSTDKLMTTNLVYNF